MVALVVAVVAAADGDPIIILVITLIWICNTATFLYNWFYFTSYRWLQNYVTIQYGVFHVRLKSRSRGKLYILYNWLVFTVHDYVIICKHFSRYWPFVWGIHRSPVNSPHKGQRRGALMFSLICAWINGWINNREAGDLRCHRDHYDVIVMNWPICSSVSLVLYITFIRNCNRKYQSEITLHKIEASFWPYWCWYHWNSRIDIKAKFDTACQLSSSNHLYAVPSMINS